MKEIGDAYIAAANKGIQWALSRLNENGSFRGSETMLMGHYKAVQTLATAGYFREAERIVAFLYPSLAENGDFNTLPGDPRPPATANYRNCWLCWGCHTIGAYDLSIRGGQYLERAQNEVNGGLPFRCEKEPLAQNVDWGTTASAVIAFLALGRASSAAKAGECLQNMLDQQPKPEAALHLGKTWSGEWITSFAPSDATRFVVEFGKSNQVYWYFGIGMSAFGKLYLATGEKKWLEAALKTADLAEKCSPAVYESLTSAKVGWGASVLYRITGQERFKVIVLHVGDYLLKSQTAEGVWIRRPQFTSINDQPIPHSLDTTLERCLWLMEMAKGLGREEKS